MVELHYCLLLGDIFCLTGPCAQDTLEVTVQPLAHKMVSEFLLIIRLSSGFFLCKISFQYIFCQYPLCTWRILFLNSGDNSAGVFFFLFLEQEDTETKPTHVDLHFKKSPAPRGGSGHKACFLFSWVRGTWHYITQIRAHTEAKLLGGKKREPSVVWKVWISRGLKFVWLIQRRGAGGKSFSENLSLGAISLRHSQPLRMEPAVSWCGIYLLHYAVSVCMRAHAVWWLSWVILHLRRWWRQAEGGVAWWNSARCGSSNDWLCQRIKRCARWED